ncbi:GntR family transcriptional regulator [Actinocorallia aurantiaca]
MSEIDFDGPDPIYVQLSAVLERRIKDGTYPPNRKIPPEAGLREEFGVARNTVRAAIKVLTDRGMLRPVVGRGVFVLPWAVEGTGPEKD